MTDVIKNARAAEKTGNPEFSNKIISGKAVSARIRAAVRKEAAGFEAKSGRKPALAVIIVSIIAAIIIKVLFMLFILVL